MIGTIFFREIQEYIKSLRFLIGLLFIVGLVILCMHINIKDYIQRDRNYQETKFKKNIMHGVYIYKQPHVLSIFSQGKEKKTGNRVHLGESYIPSRTTGQFGRFSRQDMLFGGFEAVDFVFIVRVIISLFIIFLTYDTISQEKFQGTLRLSLANNIPRHRILLGKFLAGFFIVFVSLTFACVISLILIEINPAVSLETTDWLRLAAMFAVSLLYLSLFYTISLFVSTIINTPSIVLSVLLQIWVILLIIYPNFSVFLADTSYLLPSEDKLAEQRLTSMVNAYEIRPKLEYYELQNKCAEEVYKIEKNYENELSHMAERARNFAMFSPAVLFDTIISRYACTGIGDYERFLDKMYLYWEDNIRFKNNQAFSYGKNEYIYFQKLMNLPEYIYYPEKFTESFTGTAFYQILLILLNVVFFLLSYTFFLRKDVR